MGPVLGTYIAFNEARRANLLALILDTPSLRSVVIHGMPPGTLELSDLMRAKAPGIKVFFVYHGALSAPFHVSSGEATLLAGILDLTQEGIVHSVGTVKYGFHETLLALGSRRALTVPNFPVVLPHLILEKYSARDGLLHIGVLASSGGSHKNLIAQLIAACIRPGAVVHVTVLPAIDYLDSCQAQVIETGLLPHDQFIVEVTKMDVLMYVSLVECFPMLVLESAAAGIPILVSRTHHIFDSDPVLDRALVVQEADSPSEISKRLAELASSGLLLTSSWASARRRPSPPRPSRAQSRARRSP
jgi:glycosyltransferase involved in cell wall biosynthesis